MSTQEEAAFGTIFMRRFFKKLKEGTEHLNYGRHIIRDWGASLYLESSSRPFRILDLGCGPGTDLRNIRQEIQKRASEAKESKDRKSSKASKDRKERKENKSGDTGDTLELYGLESWPPNIAICKQHGIKTYKRDLEHDKFPGKAGHYDLVLANQVLEHTKEIFWIFSEVGRILRPGGHFIVGVPNLASFHNRILLLFGQQPTQIQSMSAHVRGFTKPDLRAFAETGGYFELTGFRGSNFYPLPPLLSRPLARMLPTFAWGAFFLFRRTEKQGSFLECLQGSENFLETPFYGSPQNPAR